MVEVQRGLKVSVSLSFVDSKHRSGERKATAASSEPNNDFKQLCLPDCYPRTHKRVKFIVDSKRIMASTMDIANPCAICYEIPQLYGILENCGHTFCYECIANWRHPFKTSARQCSPAVRRLLRGAPSFMERNAERDGTRNPKTYPLCSKLSLHIYKAANFPKTMQAKTAIIINCKAQRKRQVCRDL